MISVNLCDIKVQEKDKQDCLIIILYSNIQIQSTRVFEKEDSEVIHI